MKSAFMLVVTVILLTTHIGATANPLPRPFPFELAAAKDDKGPSFPRPGFENSNQKDNRKSLHSGAGAQRGIDSREAARIAKKHIGGKVLKVRPSSNGHRVKILLPSGKVTYINVSPDGKIQ